MEGLTQGSMKIKDYYNKQSVAALAGAIRQFHPGLDPDEFLSGVFDDAWQGRELKERTRHITTVLNELLPPDYRASLQILDQALPLLSTEGIVKLVFPDFVEVYGLHDWEASIAALEAFTQEISAEFSIRPFIVRYPERTMVQMLAWAHHEHPEVRRLASEGCRPRLPWGIRLHALLADPSPILPILEKLRDDESESVRRSVANNLNDISKDNPEVVLALLRHWQAERTPETDWITRHALRTLLKKGDAQALELLGYPSDPAIAVHHVAVEPATIPVGGEVTLSFEIESCSDQAQNLMVDYVVHHMRANGQLSPKVFKLTKKKVEPGQVLHIARKHSFRPVSTRRYYPGQHAIEPKINGRLFKRVEFRLAPAETESTSVPEAGP
jgi:3-methyladenine DNA glycosylase AlkC